MSLHPYHVVIRGGAWTSIGDLLHPRYRGLDLLSDRHCEIGFRVAARNW
jgi:formylglycine-generating enzyme required for sulfatase activity